MHAQISIMSTSNVASLFVYTLVWSVTILTVIGTPILDFSLASQDAPNVFRFECINNGEPDSSARFEVYNSTGGLITEQFTDANQDFSTYNIVQDSIIRCIVEEQLSEDVMFAAMIPNVSNQTISNDVLRNTYAMLTCPIPLPTLRSLYTIIWEQIEVLGPIRIIENSESRRYMLSLNNKTLSVLISNITDQWLFRCTLKFRRCSYLLRCKFINITGPLMRINMLDRSEITVSPSSQTVASGDTAIFQCNAEGSNISVRWSFNGLPCGLHNCERNGIYINKTQEASMINTTLEIRTSELRSVMTEKKNYTIQCIVEQTLKSSSFMNSSNFSSLIMTRNNISIILTVAPQLQTESGITTTAILSSGSSATSSEVSSTVTSDFVSGGRVSSSIFAIGVSVPVGILLLAMCIGIILTIIWIKRKNTKKFDKELQEMKLHIKEQPSNLSSLTENYVKTTKLGDEKTGLSESYVKKISESNLLIPGRHIQLEHTIGQGEFGLVYQSYLTSWQGRTTPEVVAVKTLKSFYSTKNIEELIAESERMKKFNHPNVMNLIGVCIDVGERPYIVMPFMANGSLLAYLKKERSCFVISEDAEDEKIEDLQRKLLSMCLQVAMGMSYLAKHKFVHRDLAARNCMIDDKFVIKVGDFGLSEEIYTTNYFRQGEGASVKLPVKWMALESLLDGIFSERTDVWSFGVTCWEIFSLGHTPYPAFDPIDLVKFLKSGERLEKPTNTGCTDQVYALVTQCWEESPEKRPCFEDLVNDINSRLERVAGYLEFSAINDKLCTI